MINVPTLSFQKVVFLNFTGQEDKRVILCGLLCLQCRYFIRLKSEYPVGLFIRSKELEKFWYDSKTLIERLTRSLLVAK